MKGTIQYIGELQRSRNDDFYRIVTIKLDNGKLEKTYVCPSCRNYRNWQPVLSEGVILDGLVMKGGLIDADSPIQRISPQ